MITMLTVRERESLALVSKGKRNKQVARRLGIAEHTVEAHLANIFRKLQVRNRTAAAERFWRSQARRSAES